MKRRKDGRWKKTITINGVRKSFYSTATTERQAERDLLQQIANFHEKEEKGKLFETVANEWSEEHFKKLTYNTIRGYKPHIEYATSFFKNRHINDIHPIDVKNFMNKRIKNGFSSKCVSNQMSVLNMILRYACIEGYIRENPAQYVTVPQGLPKNPRKIPTKEEIEIVKNSTAAPFGILAYTLLYLGLRKGEILALEATDIDRKNNRVYINKSVYFKSNKPFTKLPKTRAGKRVVVLPQCLKDVLPNNTLA